MGFLQKLFFSAGKAARKAVDKISITEDKGCAAENMSSASESEKFLQENIDQVTDFIRFCAEDGDAKDQHELGRMYYCGVGPYGHGTFEQNTEKAMEWFKKSADQGFAVAMASLGACYSQQQNKREALRYYQLAADKNDPDGLIGLAILYHPAAMEETVLQPDYCRAHTLFYKAALQDDAFAQFIVASNFERGEGVEPNNEEAVEWYWKAAQNNQPNAQLWVGNRYESSGRIREAIEWYEKAAQNGNTAAAQKLADLR